MPKVNNYRLLDSKDFESDEYNTPPPNVEAEFSALIDGFLHLLLGVICALAVVLAIAYIAAYG